MKTKNKVSVIIPCYNDGKCLPEAVLSVEKCNKDLYEIIVIDDGSTDQETDKALDLIEKKGHRVFHIKHAGQSAARNFGVKKAKYSYILFLDADNKIIPEYIERGIKMLDKNPEVGIIYGNRREFGLRERVAEQEDFDISKMIFENYIDTCAIIRKKVWQDCKGFDKKMFMLEDWEFWINAYKHGWKFKRIPKTMFYYRVRNNSVTSKTRIKNNRIKILKYVYKKHYPFFIREMGEKNALIDRDAGQLNYKDIQISQMQEQIHALKQELLSVKRSFSWRFSQRLEKIIFYFLPENSALGRFYKFLLHRLQNFKGNKASQGKPEPGIFLKKSKFRPLRFKKVFKPEVSIIIPVFNNWAYTYNCLYSVLKNTKGVEYEIIVADDNSSDKTKEIKKSARNIKVIRNKKNLGFLENCNNAVNAASGKYLLFLNNDTYVLKNSISCLLDTIKRDDKFGAVGGKVILPDGTLQEAGSIVWRNGSTLGYGRGDSPLKPEYNFLREVDYCSGTFLLVRKDLFLKFGKFDVTYRPGYYEEVDFSMKLKKAGYKTIYQPAAEILHYESVSFGRNRSVGLHIKNAPIFFSKWRQDLVKRYAPKEVLKARFYCDKKQILYIEDQIPDSKPRSGYPRACAILENLLDIGFQVTFYPAAISAGNPGFHKDLQQKGVEVMYETGDYKLNFKEFFRERKNYYHSIFVSRPHNMAAVIKIIKKYNPAVKIIYDAESISALKAGYN